MKVLHETNWMGTKFEYLEDGSLRTTNGKGSMVIPKDEMKDAQEY